MARAFRQLDVFGSAGLAGNPLAVVLDADGLTDEQMLAFTRWTNLSEATFVLPPTDPAADYRVRIFFPAGELPFAGHPTLGTCAAWLRSGGRPADPTVVVQQCGAGLVRIRHDGDRLAFAAPPLLREGPVADDLLADVLQVLGVPPADVVDAAWVDNGPGWIGVLLHDVDTLLGLRPDLSRWSREEHLDVGVAARHPAGGPADVEVRAFFEDATGTLREDPVTGSLNASLATWAVAAGHAPASYVARQGTVLGRDGRVHCEVAEDGTTWIGGLVHEHVVGVVDLDVGREVELDGVT